MYEILNISNNDINTVEEDTLVVGVNKLREANLDSTNLTMGQIVAIFGKCGGGSKLNLLSLKSNQELQFFPRVKVFNQRNVLSLLRQAERKINKLIF